MDLSITLKQLAYYVAAVETGNITVAAERLHVAQTAIGQQIRNLEANLGTALLVRHSRGIGTTAQGAVVYEKAKAILAQVEALSAGFSSPGVKRRVLSLGITPSISRLIGPELAMASNTALETIDLLLVEELSFVLLEALNRGELDVVLAYEVAPSLDIRRIPILEERLLFLQAPGADNAGAISFSEAVASDLALNGSRDIVWKMVHATAERLSLKVNAVFELQSVDAINNLVSRGVATSIVPYGVVADELTRGKLVGRPIEHPVLTRTLFLAFNERRHRLEAFDELFVLLDDLIGLLSERIGPYATRLSKLT